MVPNPTTVRIPDQPGQRQKRLEAVRTNLVHLLPKMVQQLFDVQSNFAHIHTTPTGREAPDNIRASVMSLGATALGKSCLLAKTSKGTSLSCCSSNWNTGTQTGVFQRLMCRTGDEKSSSTCTKSATRVSFWIQNPLIKTRRLIGIIWSGPLD